MNEAPLNGYADYDPALFSPEELAMMREANGSTADAIVADANELQAQLAAVAKLVAEGGERERQLRALINDLTVLARTSEQQARSIYEQTQTLARIVITSSEREVKLQENLETMRGLALCRARGVT